MWDITKMLLKVIGIICAIAMVLVVMIILMGRMASAQGCERRVIPGVMVEYNTIAGVQMGAGLVPQGIPVGVFVGGKSWRVVEGKEERGEWIPYVELNGRVYWDEGININLFMTGTKYRVGYGGLMNIKTGERWGIRVRMGHEGVPFISGGLILLVI